MVDLLIIDYDDRVAAVSVERLKALRGHGRRELLSLALFVVVVVIFDDGFARKIRQKMLFHIDVFHPALRKGGIRKHQSHEYGYPIDVASP